MKFEVLFHLFRVVLSHPSWGAWIEMHGMIATLSPGFVAPLMGCVD